MNDNRKVYQQVMRIIKKNMVQVFPLCCPACLCVVIVLTNFLVRYFGQVDDMFYGKEDVAPVKLQCLISEVYSMHFGGFDEE